MNKSLLVAIALFVSGSLMSIATPSPEAKAGLFRHHCGGARARCCGRHRHHRRAHRCHGYGWQGCHGGYGCDGGYHYGHSCSGSHDVYQNGAMEQDMAPPSAEPAPPPSGNDAAGGAEAASPSDNPPPPPGNDA